MTAVPTGPGVRVGQGQPDRPPATAGGAKRAAVFLDRDGTIIRDVHYLAEPDRVALVDGAAAALTRLRAAGYLLVVITNQSGLAQGLITPAQYESVRTRLDTILSAAGVALDATYMCPHHPDFTGPCECRKPGRALFARAAGELDIDLSRSVLIGDRWRDVAAAPLLGARGVLVAGPVTPAGEIAQAAECAVVVTSLAEAVDHVEAR